MVEEVGIVAFVNGPMGIQESYMLMQQVAVLEGSLKGAQQLLLALGQLQRILWDSRLGKFVSSMGILFFPSTVTVPFSKSTASKKDPVVHLVLRMALNDGALHFKLITAMALCILAARPGPLHRTCSRPGFGHEPLAGVVLVHLGCKHGQRPQIDAVAVLQHVEAVVADGDTQHIADAGQVSCGRAHPGDVVVSPLDVHIVEVHQFLHNDLRPGTSVENVPDDM